MTFHGTGLSVRAGTAFPMYLWDNAGQSNCGTGGSPASEMPAVIPSPSTAGRMFCYYKSGLWRLARESVQSGLNLVFDVQTPAGIDAIGPCEFMLDGLLLDAKLNGLVAGVLPCARGGTWSIEWIPSALSPPGATLYSSNYTGWRNAMRRPNTTYKGKVVWQGEANSLSGLSSENDFTAASWTKVAVTPTLNQATSPIGGIDGQRLTETVANSAHSVAHGFNELIIGGGTAVPLIGTVVTYTLWMKTGTLATPRNWGYISGDGGLSICWFNLNTGAVGTQTACTGTITNAGNGWFKCDMTFTFTAAGTGVTYGLATGNGVTSYAGSVTADLLVWDATTNAMAVRWFNDWVAHRAQWRIDASSPNAWFHFVNLTASTPPRSAGSHFQNWQYMRNTVIPQILADPFTTLTQSVDGPFLDTTDIHEAVGSNPSEGQWGTGLAVAATILGTL